MGRAIHGFTMVVLGLAAPAADLAAQDSAAMARFHAIPWQDGPTNGGLSEAQVRVPDGCRFAGAAGTREFLEFTENPVSGNERGVMLCRGQGEQRSWFVIFTFDDIGFVKDEEKDELDADKILASLREVAEGVETARSVVTLADQRRVEMPICRAVHAALHEGKPPRAAITELLERPLKTE